MKSDTYISIGVTMHVLKCIFLDSIQNQKELERFVTKRYPEVELQVTDTQTEMLDNKVLMLIGDSATAPNGNPSPEAIKLENIWDLA